jgi:hypothetical protein
MISRNWFLERVLKLGLTPVAKEYLCVRTRLQYHVQMSHASSSSVLNMSRPPNLRPSRRREMETRLPLRLQIRLASNTLNLPSLVSILVFLSPGPCQPSMVYRYLRTLEGVSPPLSLTHLSCQTTAKAFVATREFRVVVV